MKKYLIGTIFGFILATAASANAEGVTRLIDQVVQGVFPVTIEGTSIGEAVVIDNKTYLPVREFGEAVGYTVSFTEAREVVLTKKADVSIPTTPTVPVIPQPTPTPQATGPTDEVLVDITLPKEKQIDYLKAEISGLESSIPIMKFNYKNSPTNTELEKGIARDEKRLASMKTLLEQLQQ